MYASRLAQVYEVCGTVRTTLPFNTRSEWPLAVWSGIEHAHIHHTSVASLYLCFQSSYIIVGLFSPRYITWNSLVHKGFACRHPRSALTKYECVTTILCRTGSWEKNSDRSMSCIRRSRVKEKLHIRWFVSSACVISSLGSTQRADSLI